MIRLSDMSAMVWLFPILFMLHDFEELILIQPWIVRNKRYLGDRFPVLSKRMLSHFEDITTASFAFGVAEEFILIVAVTIVSFVTNWYPLWLGLFIAFILHLAIHCVQALIIRKYVPALVTSLMCLPICILLIGQTELPLNTVLLYSALGFGIMAANLVLVHRGMTKLGRWLARYEERSK